MKIFMAVAASALALLPGIGSADDSFMPMAMVGDNTADRAGSSILSPEPAQAGIGPGVLATDAAPVGHGFKDRVASTGAEPFTRAAYWIDPRQIESPHVKFGYAWNRFSVEHVATPHSGSDDDYRTVRDIEQFRARTARISYHASGRWVFQLARGTVSGLDQMVSELGQRRTALSATNTLAFSQGSLQTTVAWGRTSRRFKEPTLGYLLESTLRFNGAHSVFSRLEQVGSDELRSEDGARERRLSKLSRFTVGYAQNFRPTGNLSLDVGGYISRYDLPPSLSAISASDPTSYMMFVRLKLR